MTFLKVLFAIIFVLGLMVCIFFPMAGAVMISIALFGLWSTFFLEIASNVRAIKRNSDAMLKIAMKNTNEQ